MAFLPGFALARVVIGDDGGQYLDTDDLVHIHGDDLVGADEVNLDNLLIGDAIEGRRHRRRHRSSMSQRPVHKKRVRASSGVFGLDAITVIASGSGDLEETIQEPVHFQRLVLDGETGFFKVVDIKIGAKSQMSGTAPFPAGAFRPDATNAAFSLNKRGRVGQVVKVSVTNIDAANPHSISGMIKTLEKRS